MKMPPLVGLSIRLSVSRENVLTLLCDASVSVIKNYYDKKTVPHMLAKLQSGFRN